MGDVIDQHDRTTRPPLDPRPIIICYVDDEERQAVLSQIKLETPISQNYQKRLLESK